VWTRKDFTYYIYYFSEETTDEKITPNDGTALLAIRSIFDAFA
jgi:hypothetical protein